MNNISSRDFTGRVAQIKRAALTGPVFITDRGTPSHVLLHIDQYRRLTSTGYSLADALAMKDGDDIPFDPPKIDIGLRVPDFA
jgi:prevent-host-death family protein